MSKSMYTNGILTGPRHSLWWGIGRGIVWHEFWDLAFKVWVDSVWRPLVWCWCYFVVGHDWGHYGYRCARCGVQRLAIDAEYRAQFVSRLQETVDRIEKFAPKDNVESD